jgi:hypothetical protein
MAKTLNIDTDRQTDERDERVSLTIRLLKRKSGNELLLPPIPNFKRKRGLGCVDCEKELPL